MNKHLTPPSDRIKETDLVLNAVDRALTIASKAGAQAAATASVDDGKSIACRMQELETLEFHRSQQLTVTVYDQQCKGSASTSDLSDAAIEETVKAALQIARFTSEDPNAGLADAELMATDIQDMELYHPHEMSAEQGIEAVLACEKAGLEHDKRIDNSEGATINAFTGTGAYGNTHGFASATSGTSYSLSCSMIAKDDNGMQRDYWYSSERDASLLASPESIGETAAMRAIRRLSPRSLTTREAPVIFSAEIAKSLVGHLFSALAGQAIYRQASFLLDRIGDQLFPSGLTIYEDPHIVRGHSSASYDREGVATRKSNIIEDGKICRYILSSYSARRLGLATTANAGGTRNVRMNHGDKSLDQLIKNMGTGLLATELIGQGVNNVTGDYSRGVAGFWVENGEIQYPVEELTIAGNLNDMYAGLVEIGADTDKRGNVHTGSWLIDNLTIAGG